MKHDAYLAHRVRALPVMLENARRKVMALENEARRYRMFDLLLEPMSLTQADVLKDPTHTNRAWDRETEIARIQADDKGEANRGQA